MIMGVYIYTYTPIIMAGFGFIATLSTNKTLPGSSNTIPPDHLRDPATGVSIHLVNQVTVKWRWNVLSLLSLLTKITQNVIKTFWKLTVSPEKIAVGSKE